MTSPQVTEAVLLRRKIKAQRRELRRLNVALKRAKEGYYFRKTRERWSALEDATAALRHITGDAPWNAGMHHGMRMVRDMLAGRIDAGLIVRLSHEIAWRFEGEARDDAKQL